MKFDLDQAVAILERTPRLLRELLAGLPEPWTHSGYGPGTWSAAEVVAHLIFGEHTDWIPRMRIILMHGEARAFDSFDRAGHSAIFRANDTARLLELFERERATSIMVLRERKLSESDLDRRGMHPALGEVTLRNLLAAWVVHDLNHIAQVCKALAHQYKDQVGPWEAYMSILAPPSPR